MKEKIKKIIFFDLEKAILNNLTRISFYIILLFSILQLLFFVIGKNFLEIKEFITLLGAIFVFWYGFKRYERDKELEIFNNVINLNKDESEFNIMNIFYINYVQYINGHISKDIWKVIELHFITTYNYIFVKNKDKSNKIKLVILLTIKTFDNNMYIRNFFIDFKKNKNLDKGIKNAINEILEIKDND